MNILTLNHCSLRFGGLAALSNFSLSMDSGELVCLIGPNGAGKTTAFNMISGIYQCHSGDILFLGKSIRNLRPSQICRLGLARTFQNIRLFGSMSVLENVRVAHYIYLNRGLARTVFRWKSFYDEEAKTTRDAMKLLESVGLQDTAHEEARNLPYGKQRKLEIVRALATKPKLLLLDEPAAGMNPSEKSELITFVKWIHQTKDVSILMIEHDMNVVMGISERIIVLDHGEEIAAGLPQEIQKDARVIEAYLGEREKEC